MKLEMTITGRQAAYAACSLKFALDVSDLSDKHRAALEGVIAALEEADRIVIEGEGT